MKNNKKIAKKSERKTSSKKKAKSVCDYIVIDGVTYEKMSKDSVNLELDLHEDVLNYLDKLIKSGKFVSRGDAIRTILRNKIEELDNK